MDRVSITNLSDACEALWAIEGQLGHLRNELRARWQAEGEEHQAELAELKAERAVLLGELAGTLRAPRGEDCK